VFKHLECEKSGGETKKGKSLEFRAECEGSGKERERNAQGNAKKTSQLRSTWHKTKVKKNAHTNWPQQQTPTGKFGLKLLEEIFKHVKISNDEKYFTNKEAHGIGGDV